MEYNKYNNYHYGTSKKELSKPIKENQVIFEL